MILSLIFASPTDTNNDCSQSSKWSFQRIEWWSESRYKCFSPLATSSSLDSPTSSQTGDSYKSPSPFLPQLFSSIGGKTRVSYRSQNTVDRYCQRKRFTPPFLTTRSQFRSLSSDTGIRQWSSVSSAKKTPETILIPANEDVSHDGLFLALAGSSPSPSDGC